MARITGSHGGEVDHQQHAGPTLDGQGDHRLFLLGLGQLRHGIEELRAVCDYHNFGSINILSGIKSDRLGSSRPDEPEQT